VTEEGKSLMIASEVRRMIENVEHATGVTTMMTGYCLEDIAHDIDCTASASRLGFWMYCSIQLPAMVLVVHAVRNSVRQHIYR